MSYGLFSVVDWRVKLKVFEGFLDVPAQAYLPIKEPEDWANLKPIACDTGKYAVILESQRIVLSKVSGIVPVVQTVFSPLTSALKMAGEKTLLRHINKSPKAVHTGLEVIAETTRQFAYQAVIRGADGVFFATQKSNAGQLTYIQHDEFVKKYDMRVLGAVEGKF